jgi:E3 ubiquitin-protein ligase HOS1
MMKSKLPQLQKFAVQLAGISSVVEAMIASFREAAHVNDLHQLIENTMKAKQVSFLKSGAIRVFMSLNCCQQTK